MTEHNREQSAQLAQGAKWVIRQLLLEVESRGTEIELFDPEAGQYVIFYRLLAGQEATVEEFAQKLSIDKQGQRLEVQHA